MPDDGPNETDHPDSYPDCYPDCPTPEYTDCDSTDDDPTNDCESTSSDEIAKHEIPVIKETPTEGKYI